MDRTCRSWSSTPSPARLRETRRQCTAWRAEQPPRSLTSSSLHLLVKVITRTLVHDRWTRAASGGEDSATALRSQGRRGTCREHMICPLPRANEMSALSGEDRRSIAPREGRYDLRSHRLGAGDEDPGSHPARDEWSGDVAAGRRHPR